MTVRGFLKQGVWGLYSRIEAIGCSINKITFRENLVAMCIDLDLLNEVTYFIKLHFPLHILSFKASFGHSTPDS